MEKLLITLKSDLCSGSGFSFAGIIDSDVSFDKYGFPYISGRRIKGCMREAAELLGIYEDDITSIFGKRYAGEYDTGTGISISDAYPIGIPSQEDMEIIYSDADIKKYLGQERVVNCFTSIRSQTKIESSTGIAKDNTLRFTRVVNKDCFADKQPLQFTAQISIPENIRTEVIKIIKSTRNLGMDRNRGLGSVKLELIEGDEKDTNSTSGILRSNTEYDENDKIRISYVIRNESPLVISSEKDTVSMDYIPGYTVLGAFAKVYLSEGANSAESEEFKDLFLNGKTVFSNLNHAEKIDGKWYLFHEAPSYINRLKKTAKLVDTDVLIEKDEQDRIPENDDYYYKNGNQPKKLTGKYIAKIGNKYAVSEVSKEIVYHHTKKSEKTDASNGNRLFFFEAVSKGQLFAGEIITDGRYAQTILNVLDKGYIYLGKSRSAQYGRCKILKDSIEVTGVKETETKTELKEGSVFLINLQSDAVFMDKEGNYTSDYKTVWNIIRESINAADEDPGKSYAKTGVTCGYSGIWNLHKQEIPVVLAGSTFAFISKNHMVYPDDFPDFLGIKNSEGFGKFEIEVHPDTYKLDELKKEIKTEFPSLELIKKNKLLKEIVKTSLLDIIFNNAKAGSFEKRKIGVSASTLGRLNLMAIEAWNSCGESNDSDKRAEDAYKSFLERIDSIKSDSSKTESKRYIKDLFGVGDWKGNGDSKSEVVNHIIDNSTNEYRKLVELVAEPDAENAVFNLWYRLISEVLTYQKYLKKEDA